MDDDLFQDIPDEITTANLRALGDLEGASNDPKFDLYSAVRDFQEAKLTIVAEHIESKASPVRCEVEHVHPRGNGPSLSIIPESKAQEGEIVRIIDAIPDVEVFHRTGDWLNVA